MSPRMIPDPTTEPTITVERAAAILGIGRRTAYRSTVTGEIPSVRVGRRYCIPTAKFLAAFDLAAPAELAAA